VARLVSLQEMLSVRGHPEGKGAHVQRPEHFRDGQSLVARKVAGCARLLVDQHLRKEINCWLCTHLAGMKLNVLIDCVTD
jgi:hypothetical protein